MNEWEKYDKKDKHQIAFRSLVEKRGAEIAQRLGYRDAVQIPACIKCHAITDPDDAPPDRNLLSDGVTS